MLDCPQVTVVFQVLEDLPVKLFHQHVCPKSVRETKIRWTKLDNVLNFLKSLNIEAMTKSKNLAQMLKNFQHEIKQEIQNGNIEVLAAVNTIVVPLDQRIRDLEQETNTIRENMQIIQPVVSSSFDLQLQTIAQTQEIRKTIQQLHELLNGISVQLGQRIEALSQELNTMREDVQVMMVSVNNAVDQQLQIIAQMQEIQNLQHDFQVTVNKLTELKSRGIILSKKKCRVVWDYENVPLPANTTHVSTILHFLMQYFSYSDDYDLEHMFIIGHDDAFSKKVKELASFHCTYVRTVKGIDSADRKVTEMIKNFIEAYGYGHCLVVISSDGDYEDLLLDYIDNGGRVKLVFDDAKINENYLEKFILKNQYPLNFYELLQEVPLLEWADDNVDVQHVQGEAMGNPDMDQIMQDVFEAVLGQ